MDSIEIGKILLEEYKVLHAELLQSNTILVQVIGACIAASIALFGFAAAGNLPKNALVALLGIVGGAGLITWRIVDNDSRYLSSRIVDIELHVNKLAGDETNMVLSWERRFGIAARGYKDRWRRANPPDVR